MAKKQKRTLKPVLDPSAAGKNKRLPKEPQPFGFFKRKDVSKFHD